MWRFVCLSIGMVGISSVPSLAAVEYTFIDLGTLGGSRAIATAVSDTGRVAGCARDGDGIWHAFRWNPEDGLVALGIEASASWAYGINGAGHIAGYFQREDSSLQAYTWTQAEGVVELVDLGGGHSTAFSVSNAGIVVGDATLPTGETRAMRWDSDGTPHDLGTFPDGTSSTAHAVNTGGVVAGSAHYAVPGGSPYAHACVWHEDGTIEDLDTLGGLESYGMGINDLGWVVGFSGVETPYYAAFLWKPSEGMTEIAIPATGPVYAYDVNNAGTVTGYLTGESTRAFAWNEAEGVTILEAFGGTTMARGINDMGWIVGEAWGADDGYAHAVAWIPEPATFSLLVVGLLVASRRRSG